ncbi:MAG: Gfo/Idh/MocA family oxidoreductase [Blautia sp.]|nr:Gfo/Idh/MocA family oxidoreductase [Blautia sp.]MDY3997993.1 Gfo/Idh/MocA family oxidoreductase [Blautia sp.]
MKFSILAPGGIARKMAEAVSGLESVQRYAVASRTYDKAKAFADEWGFEKAYGSYEEMLEDPEVELVYIATPHSHHYQYARMCLEHGKHVLVEKAFTVNAAQAEELIRLSEEKGLLLTEAIWTRYMPSRRMIDELVDSGVIGEVTSLTANLGYVLDHVERMQNPELAGGALLDLGVYPINFAMMVFHSEIKNVASSAVMSPKGIDWMNSITLTFEDGKMAVLHSNMLAQTDREGVINGSKGYIEIQNINNCEEIRVFNLDREITARYQVPEQINGYEYEVIACQKAIEDGRVECEEMPHSETLKVMKLMDEIRGQWGMKYPCE